MAERPTMMPHLSGRITKDTSIEQDLAQTRWIQEPKKSRAANYGSTGFEPSEGSEGVTFSSTISKRLLVKASMLAKPLRLTRVRVF